MNGASSGFTDQNPAAETEAIPSLDAAFRGRRWDIPPQIIPKTLIAEAILNPPLTWFGTGMAGFPRENQFIPFKYPADGCSEIHMIWSDAPCLDTCWNHGNKTHQALRDPKIEFLVVQHPWMENECLFADIVLPTNTKFEQEDIGAIGFSGQFSTLLYEGQSIGSIGESMSPYEAVGEVAKKLGLYEEYTERNGLRAAHPQGV